MTDFSETIALKLRKEAARLGFAAIGFSRPAAQTQAMERFERMLGD
ncbi:MAG: tRNA epoxyqueuosine(34) reductase QueG, partial [Chlorobiaceae bacterium]|nr:tRNA epoxyqueuosine(34) reductase QueG [Chlorobiaceae bacterium]